MSLTVKEILEKTFNRSFRGYDEDEVDQFLDQIIDQVKSLNSQNEALRKELAQVKEKSAKLKETEEAIMHTLVSAQKSSERILKEAARKAELVIDNAENTARQRTEKVETDLKEAERKLAAIKHSAQSFATSFAHMINAQAASFDRAYHEYFGDLDTYSSGGINSEALERIDHDMAESIEGIVAKPEQPAPKLEKKELDPPRFTIDETDEDDNQPNERPEANAETEDSRDAASDTDTHEIAEAAAETGMPKAADMPDEAMADKALLSITEEMMQPEAGVNEEMVTEPLQQPEPGGDGLMALHEINKALNEIELAQGDILQDSYNDAPAAQAAETALEQEPVQAAETAKSTDEGSYNTADGITQAAQSRRKNNYSDYSWLYENEDKADTREFELSFKDPKEKEQLKSLIDEVID